MTLKHEISHAISEWIKAGASASDVKNSESYALQTLHECGFKDAEEVRAIASRCGRRVW